MGEALKGRRDQVVLATKFGHVDFATWASCGGCRRRPRTTSAVRSRRRSAVCRPTGSTSTSCTRPTRRRPSRRRWTRSPSWCARARSATSATRTSPGGRSAEAHYVARERGTRAVRLGAERLQPAGPGCGARGAAGRRALRARVLPVLPAPERPADRQVHPGCRSRRQPHHAPAPAPVPERAVGRARRVPGVLRRARASRCSRRPSAGCCRTPALSSVIAGATNPEQVRANAAAATAWAPTVADLYEIDVIFPAPETGVVARETVRSQRTLRVWLVSAPGRSVESRARTARAGDNARGRTLRCWANSSSDI